MLGLGAEGQQKACLGEEDERVELVIDQLYHKSYQYFRICNQVVLLFSLAKIAAIPYYALQYQLTHFTVFLAALFLVSVVQLASFILIKSASGRDQPYCRIAFVLGHAEYQPRKAGSQALKKGGFRISQVYDYQDSQVDRDQSRMKNLAKEIKECLLDLDKSLAATYRMQLLAYQVVHAWAIFLLLNIEFPDGALQTLVLVVVVTGTYQYIQIYTLAAFATLALPVNAAQRAIEYCQSRYRQMRVRRRLSSQSFSPAIKGDHQCKICLMDYQLNEQITVLQCSQLHNFHKQCLREWTKTAATCPLCRKDLCQ